MKLRNKKTGNIWDFESISMKIEPITLEKIKARGCSGACYANSIAELTNEWEDVEPLIKDEKIRKAVRAWANVNDETGTSPIVMVDRCTLSTGHCGPRFETWKNTYFENLKHGKEYTVAELCGEDE